MFGVTCFSYKGGSGRSTSAANMAAQLARNGRKVLLVDFDINAPGLHYLLRVEERVKETDYPSTRDFLQSMVDVDYLLKEGVIDISKNQSNLYKGGSLHFLGCPYDSSSSVADIPKAVVCAEALQRHAALRGYDYLVIDSASGIGSLSGLGMNISDLVLMFFRWTAQHVSGTAQCFEELAKELGKKETKKYQLKTVATGVPELTNETLKPLGVPMQESIRLALNDYGRLMDRASVDSYTAQPIAQIPEYLPLKWREDIYVGETEIFIQLADKVEELAKAGAALS